MDRDLCRAPRAQNLRDQCLFLLDQALSLRVSAGGVALTVEPLPDCVQILSTRLKLVVSHRDQIALRRRCHAPSLGWSPRAVRWINARSLQPELSGQVS